MNWVNIPSSIPENMYHKTFYSELFEHEIGINIYVPPEYWNEEIPYPVAYHIHGWQGNESSEIWAMEKVYRSRNAITVFPNHSLPLENLEDWKVDDMIMKELVSFIDSEYRTITDRKGRFISGFSMGGGLAFLYAVQYPERFSKVTVYAGPFHHYFDQGFLTVGAPVEKAYELRQLIMNADNHEEDNILDLLTENAEIIRNTLQIELRIGTEDVLYCDNEIVHMHLDSLNIPHVYKIFAGVAHELDQIIGIEVK